MLLLTCTAIKKRLTMKRYNFFNQTNFFIIFFLLFFFSCNKPNDSPNNNGNNGGNNTPPVNITFTPEFSVPIIDTSKFDYILPLGNLNPISGHVYPSDHIYFYIKNSSNQGAMPQVPIYAAGNGTIISIKGYLDGGVFIAFNPNIVYYYYHINLNDTFKVGQVVKAGEIMGTTSGKASAVDLGIYNTANQLTRLLNPIRYTESTKYCEDPLKYYTANWQTVLYNKTWLVKNQKGGKIDYDIAGTIKGTWFDETQTNATQSGGGQDAWKYQLAFVPDNIDTSKQMISIGGIPGGNTNNLSLPGLWTIKFDALLFEKVTPASGIVKYNLFDAYDFSFSNIKGVLLVQMLDAGKIKVETLSDANASTFSTAAKIYVR